MPKGIVLYYLPEKGYGHIRVPETGEEFYFQRKNLRDAVERGTVVQFKVRENKYGLYAVEIKRE